MTTTTYSPLIEGDVIETGDEWQDPRTGRWQEAHKIGMVVGGPFTGYRYRRPVQHVQPEMVGVAA